MGGDDELGVGESFGQEADQLALPLRVQVQVDLVDQDDGRLGEWIGAFGIAFDHPAGEVDDPRDHCPVAVTELPEWYPAIGRLEFDAGSAMTPVEASKRISGTSGRTLIRTSLTKSMMLLLFLDVGRLAGGVIEEQEPFLGVAELCVIREDTLNSSASFG